MDNFNSWMGSQINTIKTAGTRNTTNDCIEVAGAKCDRDNCTDGDTCPGPDDDEDE